MSTQLKRICVAKWCRNYETSPSGIKLTFFRFPRDESRAKKWRKFCQMDDGYQKKHHCVCSDHFNESDFKTRYPRRLLQRDAVPSVIRAEPRLNIKTDELAQLQLASEVNNSAYPQDMSVLYVEEVTNMCNDVSGPSTKPHHPQLAYDCEPPRSQDRARSRSRSRSPPSIPSCSPNRPSSPAPSDDIPAWAIALRNQFNVLNERFSQMEGNTPHHAQPPARRSFEGLRCGKPPEFVNTPPDNECLELFYALRKQLLVPELSEKDRHEIIIILNMAAEWKSLPAPVKSLLYKLAVLLFDNTL